MTLADPLEGVDLRSAETVSRIFRDAAEANLSATCRQGSADVVEPVGTLLATGDLHDNPLHFAKVMKLAALERSTDDHPRRVTLHEIIHGSLMGGLDFSHRALARAAALKIQHPERVHTLLANHELAQIVGSGIAKDGVRVVDAFNDGVEQVFAGDAEAVHDAIGAFIRSMPLALVSGRGTGRGVLCAHSLPTPVMQDRFDPEILDRPLEESDYEPRKGSAHLMVWGRGHTPEWLDELSRIWGVELFLLGHEKAETGARFVPGRAVVLNSDHERGAAMTVDLSAPSKADEAVWEAIPLESVEI
jgi:hypothetical protein